jgi:hypothetical protein
MSCDDELLAHKIMYMLRDSEDWSVDNICGNLDAPKLPGMANWHKRVAALEGGVGALLDQLVSAERIVLVSEGIYREAPPKHFVTIGIHSSEKHCSWCKKWGTAGGDPVCLMFGQVSLNDDGPLGSLRCAQCLAAEETSDGD